MDNDPCADIGVVDKAHALFAFDSVCHTGHADIEPSRDDAGNNAVELNVDPSDLDAKFLGDRLDDISIDTDILAFVVQRDNWRERRVDSDSDSLVFDQAQLRRERCGTDQQSSARGAPELHYAPEI
ncbi:hypothetical protein D3C80_1289770 [compost metagenome]